MKTQLAELLTPERGLIFRITHRDNLLHLLRNGVQCRSSPNVDPDFVQIGRSEIIARREALAVSVPPGGTLSDYVPFYFTPCSPMLYNVVTGYQGVALRARSEIVILVTTLGELERRQIEYVLTDRNAALVTARLAPGRALLKELPWEGLQKRDFARNDADPGKIERYMAEALVHRCLPAEAIRGIITYDQEAKSKAEDAVKTSGAEVRVIMVPSWYP